MNATVERIAGSADLDGVLEIEQASFNNPTTREWYEGELQRPEVCYIYVIRTDAERVAGFCAFWKVVDQIHINNLAIRPALRHSGLGRLLLSRVLNEARGMGAPNATLEVRRSNDAARRLYEGAGFFLAGVRASYYSKPVEDALILSRREG
ncbi:MAG TPA: ribosomal protein S18-alanine N-acetyltransferase [Vicinamibacterales bacterium]|nr:ribosomal protein S18-alanine N-acetyltransferase [Vicinamibacterales bacterium]